MTDQEFATELASRLNVLIGSRPHGDGTYGLAKDKTDALCLVQLFAHEFMQDVSGSPLADHPTVVSAPHPAGIPGRWVGLTGLLNGLCGEACITSLRGPECWVIGFVALPSREGLIDGVHRGRVSFDGITLDNGKVVETE